MPRLGEYLRLRPLRGLWRQKKYGPNERTDQSSRKIQLSNEEIPNLSDAEFKTLVISMLTEMVVHGRKIQEEVKAMKSEIKENVQGTNCDERKLGLESTVWSKRKK